MREALRVRPMEVFPHDRIHVLRVVGALGAGADDGVINVVPCHVALCVCARVRVCVCVCLYVRQRERERGGDLVLAWSVPASEALMLGCSSAHRSSRCFSQLLAISFFLSFADSIFGGFVPRTLCPHLAAQTQ